MNQTQHNNEDPRLAEMLEVIFNYAAGDLTARGTLSDDDSALDGVMAGINILGEELQANVAENKQVHQALADSENQFRTIFNTTQDGIILAEAQTRRFRMANTAICRMLGYNPDELLNLTINDIHPEKDLPEVNRQFERQIKGEIIIATLPVKRKDGSVFYADIGASPLALGGQKYIAGIFRDITERRQAQQALSESEALLKTLFDSVQDGIILAEAESRRFRMVNASICRMLGYSPGELLDLGVEGIHPEEEIAYVLSQFERLAKGEIGVAPSLPMKRKDGSVFYADVNTGPMMVNGVACLVGVFRDITERKLAEQALQESEDKYRKLFENSHEALMVIMSPSWQLTEANQAALQMFGAAGKTEIGALGPWDVSPVQQPDGRPSVEKAREMIAAAVRDGFHSFEWECRRLNGETFLADVVLTRIEVRGQIALQATARDISERKRQEQALRESEARFKSILENVVEMFFIADASLHPEYMSPRCLDIYGYTADEMTARPALWMEAIHPEDRASLERRVSEEIRDQARAVQEYRIIRKDGSVRWVRRVSNPILDTDGKLQRMYGTVTDVTEFESLRSSLKEKEVLLKEVHHRVKNNLQIVISLMRLESRAFSEERVRAALKDLETRIRAMALVHEHLYHSGDLAKIGFKDYLKVLCEELFRTYNADGGRIRLEIDAEAVTLDIGRAIPCGLVINELLTNAIKYAFPGNRKGLIRVAIRNTHDGGIEIVVADDGIGMPGALDIRNTQTLGLQLVTTLVENQLKGRFELERSGGTKFKIQFGI